MGWVEESARVPLALWVNAKAQGLLDAHIPTPSVPVVVARGLQASRAFQLMVVVTFATAADKQQFKVWWKPLADYVRDHEPDTLSFRCSDSDREPLRALLLERYQTENCVIGMCVAFCFL